MDYETFSYNNIRHILYISYHIIIYSHCNARALTYINNMYLKSNQIGKYKKHKRRYFDEGTFLPRFSKSNIRFHPYNLY
jgi:hypothetical protein